MAGPGEADAAGPVAPVWARVDPRPCARTGAVPGPDHLPGLGDTSIRPLGRPARAVLPRARATYRGHGHGPCGPQCRGGGQHSGLDSAPKEAMKRFTWSVPRGRDKRQQPRCDRGEWERVLISWEPRRGPWVSGLCPMPARSASERLCGWAARHRWGGGQGRFHGLPGRRETEYLRKRARDTSGCNTPLVWLSEGPRSAEARMPSASG